MLAFIDESGHPHPRDDTTRPTLVAVCYKEREARMIGGRIHALKRDVLGKEHMEIKGRNCLNRRTFRRKPEYVAFVEEFFSLLLNLPVTIFASILERPSTVETTETNMLPKYCRFLTQRIQLLAAEENDMATLLFDGEGGLSGGLSLRFNSYLYRSDEGRMCINITDAPFFVDSQTSAGIQIADMAASVIRQFEENQLFRSVPTGDLYLLAIRRYHRIIEQKTKDLTTIDGYQRPGLYRVPPEQGQFLPSIGPGQAD